MLAKVNFFDDRLTAWIESWPLWLYRPMLMITHVGQPLTVILFVTGLFVWSLWQGLPDMAIASAVVVVTCILSSGLKMVLKRARPQTEFAAKMVIQSYSFPSGHAAAATVGFGFLTYLALAALPSPWGVTVGVAAVLFGLIVCVSRIYLGAHFPSDVVGGMLLGAAGLLAIIFIVKPL